MVPEILRWGLVWAYGEGGRRSWRDVQQGGVSMFSTRNIKILRLIVGVLAIISAVMNFAQGNRAVAIIFICIGVIFLAQVTSSSSDGGSRRPPSNS